MKLELSGKEVEAVLLEYAQSKWPGLFNAVDGAHYSPIHGVEFTFDVELAGEVQPTKAEDA